jgi:hypothetical protein
MFHLQKQRFSRYNPPNQQNKTLHLPAPPLKKKVL